MAIQQIDFSCKHDVLIRNRDGSYTPMDEPYFESKKVAPGTWRILGDGDYCYLLEGNEEAIAVDCGYGAGNIRAFMQTLTDRPLRNVINTHDHFDHTANNAYFEKAYMSAETAPLSTIPFKSFEGINFPTDYEKVIVEDGDIIGPVGRPLEVFKIPDHAVGSIAMLDRKERILFSGDEFMAERKILRVGVLTYYETLERLMMHRGEFDRIATGGSGVVDARVLDLHIHCAQYILEGHEGVPADLSRTSASEMTSVEGHIVYERKLPRPVDRKKRDTSKTLRCVECQGFQFIYDINKVNC